MNFLIINSIKKYSFLAFYDVLEELVAIGYEFSLIGEKNDLEEFFCKKEWKNSKFFFCLQNKFIKKFILILWPVYFLWYLGTFVFVKERRKNKNVLMFGSFEKITNTLPAIIFKKNVYWFNLPRKKEKSILLQKLLKMHSKFIKIIVFTDFQKKKLIEQGYENDNIFVVNWGIKNKNNNRQENIFSEIAGMQKTKKGEKKFIIGTVADLEELKKIEVLFYAVKKSLTIIPNLQLIVMGDNQERKKMLWLAKKIEIESAVWFVGEQEYLQKWFANFDILVLICEYLKLSNINTITNAMSAGLPSVMQANIGFEQIATNNKNAVLIDINNSSNLLDEIINLYQNKNFYKEISNNAKKQINEKFYLNKTINELEKVWKQ